MGEFEKTVTINKFSRSHILTGLSYKLGIKPGKTMLFHINIAVAQKK